MRSRLPRPRAAVFRVELLGTVASLLLVGCTAHAAPAAPARAATSARARSPCCCPTPRPRPGGSPTTGATSPRRSRLRGSRTSDFTIDNAQGDASNQQDQAEQAITNGASVLLLVNLDSGSGAAIEANAVSRGRQGHRLRPAHAARKCLVLREFRQRVGRQAAGPGPGQLPQQPSTRRSTTRASSSWTARPTTTTPRSSSRGTTPC